MTEEQQEEIEMQLPDFGRMDWSYQSDMLGVGGAIKEQVSDLVVRELATHDTGEGDHLVVKLRKQNMTTMEAIDKLSSMLHISKDRIGYAANREKRAITEQYISVEGVSKEDINQIFTDEFELEVVGKNGPVTLGKLDANRFDVTVRDLELPESELENRIETIIDELDGKFPNYFGEQRFGESRPVVHQVGRLILLGEWEEAVWTYIAKPYEQEYKSIRKVRKELWETREVEGAAERFPENFTYEKTLLYHLTKNPGDYEGAIKRLPEGLQNLFVHAYQSWIFNRVLSQLVEEEWFDEDYEIPLVGYGSDLGDGRPSELIREVMDEEMVEQEDFRLKSVPGVDAEGSHRRAFADFRNFEISEVEEDELNMAKNKMTVRFDLPKGAYSTVFLRELMKND
ncbi:MAG: tRNA pseudouridine(13) synthase TruD [Candidatus Nanohaloarchaea archaeon]